MAVANVKETSMTKNRIKFAVGAIAATVAALLVNIGSAAVTAGST
jgi:hypothetical protein